MTSKIIYAWFLLTCSLSFLATTSLHVPTEISFHCCDGDALSLAPESWNLLFSIFEKPLLHLLCLANSFFS